MDRFNQVCAALALCAAPLVGCGESPSDEAKPDKLWECALSDGEAAEFLHELGCEGDFVALAAEPTDSSLPGAMSVKTIIDRVDEGRLYFQDSEQYSLHYDFASEHLSGVGDLPLIVDQEAFNETYYSAQRRFFLGAVTYYEGPAQWVYDISPYDTASAEMITESYEAIAAATFFGDELYYHPSGQTAEATAEELPDSVRTISTDELYEGIEYQALNLGKSCGRLVFMTAKELEDQYLSFQDVVVLDTVPNDISVAQGIVTAEFQTPLSHVNVLSQNRGTPNMGLQGAFDDAELRALEGEWVTIEVGAFGYEIKKSDEADAADCLIQPEPIEVTGMDLSITELTDVQDIVDPEAETPLADQIGAAVPAFGGKASHYAALSYVEEANTPKAFSIPVYFYNQFLEENGFDVRIEEMLADEEFLSDAAVRDTTLEELRDDMKEAPLNEDFLAALTAKLETDFPNTRMRFRSSTNAEDLGDFTGAGLYTSKSGELGDALSPIEKAIRTVWASIWFFRAYEERQYRGIDHQKVGMALLVHRSFPDEEANGVASTANPFDTSGVEPGF